MLNKSIALMLALPFVLTACGEGLRQLPAVKITAAIADGASLILDAQSISGACPGSVAWPDSSGNSNDGSIECTTGGSVQASPARVTFDPAFSTHVTTSLNANSTAMPAATWIAWVRPTAATASHILSIDDGTAFNRALVLDTSSGNQFGVVKRTPATGTWLGLSAGLNQWQYVVVEFTASDLVLHRNSNQITYGSAPGYNNTSEDFTIGALGTAASEFFEGDIGWVAVYPRQLTATEIKQTCLKLVDRFSGATCP